MNTKISNVHELSRILKISEKNLLAADTLENEWRLEWGLNDRS